LIEATSEIPGIRSVLARDVLIPSSGIPDKNIQSSIENVLHDTTDIDPDTLDVKVENGYVTLAGSVSNRSEINRLIVNLSNIKGIRGIENWTVISPTRQWKDHHVASYLQEMLTRSFVGTNVEVSFFGNTAVLTGSVPLLSTKQRMEQYLMQEDHVDRVVNKLIVTYRHPEV
jgi:osmotically-inducible protein OsmY